jgi:hypothetical protein
MALCILDADSAPAMRVPVLPGPLMTFKGRVGRAAADQGMQVSLKVLDEDRQFFEVYAEINITNPVRPERGTVRVADDGLISWHCQIRNPGQPEGGLDIDEVIRTLAESSPPAPTTCPDVFGQTSSSEWMPATHRRMTPMCRGWRPVCGSGWTRRAGWPVAVRSAAQAWSAGRAKSSSIQANGCPSA